MGGNGGGAGAPSPGVLDHPRVVDAPGIPAIVRDFIDSGVPNGVDELAAGGLLTDFCVDLATKGLLRATQEGEV